MTYRLSPAQVRAIRLGFDAGFSQASLAEKYNVSPSHVCLIIKGKRYKSVNPPKSQTAGPGTGRGRPKGDRKLSRKEVVQLKRMRQSGYSYRELGRMYAVAATTARNYCLERI